jgi:hypothetical protein
MALNGVGFNLQYEFDVVICVTFGCTTLGCVPVFGTLGGETVICTLGGMLVPGGAIGALL